MASVTIAGNPEEAAEIARKTGAIVGTNRAHAGRVTLALLSGRDAVVTFGGFASGWTLPDDVHLKVTAAGLESARRGVSRIRDGARLPGSARGRDASERMMTVATQGRTGSLVYCATRERAIEVAEERGGLPVLEESRLSLAKNVLASGRDVVMPCLPKMVTGWYAPSGTRVVIDVTALQALGPGSPLLAQARERSNLVDPADLPEPRSVPCPKRGTAAIIRRFISVMRVHPSRAVTENENPQP